MDAGIIAAFKRHYRRFHIQNAVDRDDRGEENIFKVDQLTAMKWSLAAWKEITPTTISNCFQHTGLFDNGASNDDPVEQAVENELVTALNGLLLRNPMPVDELLNNEAEQEAGHVELTDEEIINLVQAEEETVIENAEEESEPITFSKDKKLEGIAVVLSMLDLTDKTDQIVRSRLRSLQNDLRHQKTRQTTLDSWVRS